MAGASCIYATGHESLKIYPFHTAVWKMGRSLLGLPETDATLHPVTVDTVEQWRRLYNEKMKDVPNGATMTRAEADKLLTRGAGWFVYRDDVLLGIGIAADDTIESVVAAKPGAGEAVLLALCGILSSERVTLEVASENMPAMRLYKRLGFQKKAELSQWYDVGELKIVLTRKNT